MKTKFAVSALSALAVAVALATPAMAQTQHPCQADLQDVQAQWNQMTPMGMSSSKEGYRAVSDALRIATEACRKGDVVATQTNLNVVRSHLGMPQHTAPHGG